MSPPPGRRFAVALPAVLAVGLAAALYGPLLDPSAALATRDVATFHLPLRADLARLAASGGPPAWNPFVHGGQPLLSNPSYAAFYPPTWLAFALPPAYALGLSAALHAALGLAGAWVLARRLGCSSGAAALAAAGFAGAGATVSLLHAFNLFTGLAWLPWVLAGGDAALEAPPGRWRRPALAAGGALALAALNGEPVTLTVSVIGLAALAASRLGRPLAASARRAARAAVPVAAAAALAAVQVLPTLARLPDSPRGAALPAAAAADWSLPPLRAAELIWPRWLGDPMRVAEGLWFGWGRHDRDFPYLPSLYPGLLVTVLAAAALARWPIPRRRAWLLAVGLGALLALGRHTPVYEALAAAVPGLGRLRYPEKFALLAVGVLPFAAALGWQRLLDERRRGRPAEADLPLALALAVAAASAAFGAALALVPGLAAGIVLGGGPLAAAPAGLERGVGFLRAEVWWAAALALALAALLAVLRWRRPPAGLLTALALALLGADLWRAGHGLVRLLPAVEYREPPPLAREVLPAEHRVFSDQGFHRPAPLVPLDDEPGLAEVRLQLRRLEPYSGNLWAIPYALHEDYDLMLTRWGRHALGALRRDWGSPRAAVRLLGAWNVRHLVLRRPLEEMVAGAEPAAAAPASVLLNPWALSRYRFVERVILHADAATALAAARAAEYDVARTDHWLPVGRVLASAPSPPPRPDARITAVDERWPRVTVHYAAPAGGYLVAAITFDRHWSAEVDGAAVPLAATGIGQIGAAVPPAPADAPRRLVLAYRDPWLAPAAALSVVSWLGLAAFALSAPLRRLGGGRSGRQPAAADGRAPGGRGAWRPQTPARGRGPRGTACCGEGGLKTPPGQ
jgi:hypothetical protein